MSNPHPSLVRLNTEWEQLAAATVPAPWRQAEPALADCRVLGEVLGAIRKAPDEALAALLRLGSAGQAAAHRVVLQALLPRTVLDAARDPAHSFDEYLSELWVGIAGYPLARRPRRIAANLVLDVRKRVRSQTRHQPVDPTRLVGLPAPAPSRSAGLDGVLAEARRAELIDDRAVEVLHLVYSRGLRSDQAGAVLGLSAAGVRKRCSRAVRRLTAHSVQLAEAIEG